MASGFFNKLSTKNNQPQTLKRGKKKSLVFFFEKFLEEKIGNNSTLNTGLDLYWIKRPYKKSIKFWNFWRKCDKKIISGFYEELLQYVSQEKNGHSISLNGLNLLKNVHNIIFFPLRIFNIDITLWWHFCLKDPSRTRVPENFCHW